MKQKQAEGTVDIRTQLENLTLQLKGMKVRNTGQIRAQKALQMTSKHKISDSPDKVAPPPRERLLVDTVTKSYVNSSISRSISTAMSPKFAKVDKHLRGIDISGMITNKKVLFICPCRELKNFIPFLRRKCCHPDPQRLHSCRRRREDRCASRLQSHCVGCNNWKFC